MVTEELIAYIKSQLDAGMSRDEIVKTLETQGGWVAGDVAEAFAKIGQANQEIKPNTAVINHGAIEKPVGTPAQGQGEASMQKDALGDALGAQQGVQASSFNDGGSGTAHDPDSILGRAQVTEQKSNGGKKIVSTIIIVIVLLGLCAGGAYGYFTYINPKVSAYDILLETIAKNSEVTSARETANMDLSITMDIDSSGDTAMQELLGGGDMHVGYLVSYDLEYDISDKDNQKVDGYMTLGLEGDMGIMKVNFEGTLDIKMVDNIAYFRLRDTTPFMMYDLSEYENRWIEIDFDNIMPGVGIDVAEMMALQAQQQEEGLKILKEFLENPEVIEIINRSGKIEKITDTDGSNEGYHLTFQVNKEDWAVLIKKASKSFKDIVTSLEDGQNTSALFEGVDYDEYNEEMFTELEKQLESEEAKKVFEVLENLIIDMWIAKDTMLTQRSVITFNAEGIEVEEGMQKMMLDISLLGEVKKEYDVSVEVDPPSDTTPLHEFMDEVSGGMFGDAQRKGEEASAKANLSTIRAQAELYYDDNNKYGAPVIASSEACNAIGTMFEEDETIKTALKVAMDTIPTGTFVCAIGKDGKSWVISFDDPVYDRAWCVDSMGHSWESDILKAGGENSEAECDQKDYGYGEDVSGVEW